MSKKKFRVDVERFAIERAECSNCSECYVEQLWRDIGDMGMSHCSKTVNAFVERLKKTKTKKSDLPSKDEAVVILLKTGQRVYAKLFYDNENKPCMYYDDFDNWYAIKDVESVERNMLPEYIDIEVED